MTSETLDIVHVACPGCLTENRVAAARLGDSPKCGKCGVELLDGKPAALDEASFDRLVGRSGLPVLVDFWAPWCGPCRAMAPHFERAAQQLKDRVRLVKVNTEDAPGLAARSSMRTMTSPFLT